MTTGHSRGFRQLSEAPLLSEAWKVVHRYFSLRLGAGGTNDAPGLANETVKRYIAKRRREPDWEPNNLHAWLTSCAHKVLLNHLADAYKQAQATDAETLQRAADELAFRECSLIFAKYTAGRRSEIDVDRRIDLERAIRELPENQRMALVSHEVEERTLEEIACLLNTSTSTAHRLVKRAKIQLRSSPLLAAYGTQSGTQTGGGRA